ncbi:HEAT repeat domain-containing protein [Saccharibacillus alkalitolerans]|uniref:HEAT repeat domain-containing protein n=1 Tax=Saccharibacillus alkalitolerans TaxID=2705290 RepID=A0ABX0F1X4_9BACL|nr:HEAT repeat domain-containing protein [Saccharibacillus alkalitolerans]NGZ74398.1 HEAT repeat domain-containing protein [Saccharibacillus alkalitolerans]
MKKQAQLERIVWKLKMATRRDDALKEFGANRHGYRMNDPLEPKALEAFEAAAKVKLPTEFSEFLQTVGNGGAGPYYGIAPLDPNPEGAFLNRPCRLSPDMTQEQWEAMTAFLHDPSLEAAEKSVMQSELYGGLLQIGTMGWTFDMMLVLTGPYRGRIVYVDRSAQIPFFTYEANFLEWYERWLDEIIGGCDTGWFGMERAGDDGVLIDLYLSSLEEKVKVSAIQGMHKLPVLKPETVKFLLEQCVDSSPAVRIAALEILAQKDYRSALPFLERALGSPSAEERLSAARQVETYGEPGGGELAFLLERRLPLEDDHRVLCQMTRTLERGTINPLALLVPFFSHADRNMRRESIFHAGRLPGREAHAEAFARALNDGDEQVRETAVRALEGLPLPGLLSEYRRLLTAASSGVRLRRAALRRLAEYGSEAFDSFELAARDADPEIREEARRLLGRFKAKVNKP